MLNEPRLSKPTSRQISLTERSVVARSFRARSIRRPVTYWWGVVAKACFLGRREDAFEAAEEAVRILAPFFERLPEAFAGWMRIFVGNYQ